MSPGTWTELFFLDEATAFAAGHRPCALCRRSDYARFRSAWQTAFGGMPKAVDIDAILHAERVPMINGDRPLVEVASLPNGAMVELDGGSFLVQDGHLRRWTFDGYCETVGVDVAHLITPPSLVAVVRAGYQPVLHPSA